MRRYLLVLIALVALKMLMAQETKDLSLEKRFNQAYQYALQTAQEIKDAMYRFDALMSVAEALVQVGQIDRAINAAKLIGNPIYRLKAFAAILAKKQGRTRDGN